MVLFISQGHLAIIADSENSLVLGIITADKVVRLTVADATRFPGHMEWLQREPVADVVRGFSLLVKDGAVHALFPLSRLNPGPDAKLERALIAELTGILPLAPEFRILGD